MNAYLVRWGNLYKGHTSSNIDGVFFSMEKATEFARAKAESLVARSGHHLGVTSSNVNGFPSFVIAPPDTKEPGEIWGEYYVSVHKIMDGPLYALAEVAE